MAPIKVMINGIPGKVAVTIAQHMSTDPRFELIPYSLTGPEICLCQYPIHTKTITLVPPDSRDALIPHIKASDGDFIAVDFTLPSAVNENARFYCAHNLFFVMGTTGGDRNLLQKTVTSSSVCAVIAPNMAKQIVGFQAMMEYAANHFPDLFKGYTLQIRESHQQTKADTSGTAKAMVIYFNKLGIPFSENDIVKIRDPNIQQHQLGVPESYLEGHGWHTYTLTSPDQTVVFQFTHNINGRDIYAHGTMDAVTFLSKKIASGEKGKVFSMIDVLQGAGKK